jgi:enamine deaminase RidA (YjgF/YER057c/UK114 family)
VRAFPPRRTRPPSNRKNPFITFGWSPKSSAELTIPKTFTLPSIPPPVANYVDSVRVGNLLFLAGNTAARDWKYKGKVGKDLTVQEGYDTARQVGLIMLVKVRAAVRSLDHVKRVVIFSSLSLASALVAT